MNPPIRQKLSSALSLMHEMAGLTEALTSMAGSLIQDQDGQSADVSRLMHEVTKINGQFPGHIKQIEELLNLMRQLSHVVNMAGRQRMLSQKVMKNHLLKLAQGDFDPALEAQINADILQFQDTLQTLDACELNTDDIEERLERVHVAWVEFLASLEDDDVNASVRLNDTVLVYMDLAVKAYEELVEC